MDSSEAMNNLWWLKATAETTMDREALDLAIEALVLHDKHNKAMERMIEGAKEIKIFLERMTCDYNAIDAESATTTDCISRADTIKALCQECEMKCVCNHDCTEVAVVKGMPSMSEEELDYCNNCPYISWDKDCISRQQAIEVANKIISEHENRMPKWSEEDMLTSGYDTAKKHGYIADGAELVRNAIENLPPVTPTERKEPICEHYYKGYCSRFEDGCFWQCQTERTGEWVESEIPNELYVCSECGGACWSYDYQRNIVKSNYCPNCGAKMKGGTENDLHR